MAGPTAEQVRWMPPFPVVIKRVINGTPEYTAELLPEFCDAVSYELCSREAHYKHMQSERCCSPLAYYRALVALAERKSRRFSLSGSPRHMRELAFCKLPPVEVVQEFLADMEQERAEKLRFMIDETKYLFENKQNSFMPRSYVVGSRRTEGARKNPKKASWSQLNAAMRKWSPKHRAAWTAVQPGARKILRMLHKATQ